MRRALAIALLCLCAAAQPRAATLCSAAAVQRLVAQMQARFGCGEDASGGHCIEQIAYQNAYGVFRFRLAVAAGHPALPRLGRVGSTSRRGILEAVALESAVWLGLTPAAPGEPPDGLLQQVRDTEPDCDMPATAARMRELSYAEVAVPLRHGEARLAVYADGRVRALTPIH